MSNLIILRGVICLSVNLWWDIFHMSIWRKPMFEKARPLQRHLVWLNEPSVCCIHIRPIWFLAASCTSCKSRMIPVSAGDGHCPMVSCALLQCFTKLLLAFHAAAAVVCKLAVDSFCHNYYRSLLFLLKGCDWCSHIPTRWWVILIVAFQDGSQTRS